MSRETARKVLQIEAEAIASLIPRLAESFDRALELLANCQGRVVLTGMGKSGIICRKIAATLSSTGTPSLFLHPAEAIHGDLGMLTSGDVVLGLSNSGETEEIVKLLGTIKRLGIPLISMLGNTDSTIARSSDLVLDVGVNQEACPFGLAPTASTTAALALGDALAIALCEEKGFRVDDFARLHPGGRLGKRLAKVGELMHRGDQIPKVSMETRMDEVIYEMSRKGLGITSVVEDDDRLVGVISDGDLRRLLQREREEVLSRTAGQCMTKHPVTISQDDLATSSLYLMEQRKITSLMVTDASGKIIGVVHLHDLWGTEMF
ncbi:KpsF/GutQ family sugar-phosphate isomerase [Acidobacteria bacterium AH-259-O06]|nr:KpsF/GutQ family sugar-phosphate isomerase [Acidobacteria bacterium AH-259-O06]